MDNIIFASVTELAQAIRDKTVSSAEVVDACLKRIEVVNPRLNAVVQLTADTARQQARDADASLARGEIKGPLHGIPMTIKDSFDTAGVISTAGTLGRAKFVPAEDATAVARLRAAGAILLGKTNTPELTMWDRTVNLVYGLTNNPYDLARTPGGSSGGSAAIVAAGGSPLDLGSDMGGSIRNPAHLCGIAGIRPTSGRVPRTGHLLVPNMGIADAFTQVGPMARFVRDLVLTLPLIAGEDWRDPAIIPMPLGNPQDVELKGLRAAFYLDNGFKSPMPEIVAVVREVALRLAEADLIVTEHRPPQSDTARNVWYELFNADGGAAVRRLLQVAGTTQMSPPLLGTQSESAVTLAEFAARMDRWALYRREMLTYIQRYDVIICPVSSRVAALHDDLDGTDLSYTMSYNLTGWPVVVVRCGTSPEGLPIGVQVVARPWREDVALAVAQHLETVMGGWQPPALPA
ncbi:MAG: amidase [Chloroflexi bacterium]|nr:amidase [Chloroflexota bacterium]